MANDTSLRILIVEDDPLTSMHIEESLVAVGYTVCGKATDYESAVALMKKESPDLVLIDITLDGHLDGIRTAQELMRINCVPIIYLTGNTDAETYRRAKKTYPSAFLYKPFRSWELSTQIDLAIHNFCELNIPAALGALEYIYLIYGHSYIRIKSSSVVFAEADKNYTRLFLTREEFKRLFPTISYSSVYIPLNIGKIFRYLPGKFYKLSRSLRFNLDYLDRIETDHIIVDLHQVPLPDGARKKLIKNLNIVNTRTSL